MKHFAVLLLIVLVACAEGTPSGTNVTIPPIPEETTVPQTMTMFAR